MLGAGRQEGSSVQRGGPLKILGSPFDARPDPAAACVQAFAQVRSLTGERRICWGPIAQNEIFNVCLRLSREVRRFLWPVS